MKKKFSKERSLRRLKYLGIEFDKNNLIEFK
jgi:hypothetical protein